jgi:hypothetical protein
LRGARIHEKSEQNQPLGEYLFKEPLNNADMSLRNLKRAATRRVVP